MQDSHSPRYGRPDAPVRRAGFTLIELLTVIAIITLLIGIVTPALNSARRNANRTATKAMLQAITAGCEMFKNDQNQFPQSNPLWFGATGSSTEQTAWEVTGLQGAHLIVDAMLGRDLIGYDPKQGQGAATNNTSRWYAAPPGVPAAMVRQRRTTYVPPDRITLSDDNEKIIKDAFNPNGIPGLNGASAPYPDQNDAKPRVFLDKFDYPILYYRANPGATQSTQIIQSSGIANTARGNGVYDGRDNRLFTTPQSIGSSGHVIADAASGLQAGDVGANRSEFGKFIRSNRASSFDVTNPAVCKIARPVNADSFILLSPGPDGVWGNFDDVANFDIADQ